LNKLRKVVIYICRMKKYRQNIPRHHIAPLAACEIISEVDIDDMPKPYREMLIRKGEIILTKPITIIGLSISLKEGEYLRMTLK